jgi:hypothetical protein
MAVLKHTQPNNSRCANVFGGYTHASAFWEAHVRIQFR